MFVVVNRFLLRKRNNMLTATKARKLSNKVIDRKIEPTLLEYILDGIETKAKEGYKSILFYCEKDADTKSALFHLGFNIKTHEFGFIVDWKSEWLYAAFFVGEF